MRCIREFYGDCEYTSEYACGDGGDCPYYYSDNDDDDCFYNEDDYQEDEDDLIF